MSQLQRIDSRQVVVNNHGFSPIIFAYHDSPSWIPVHEIVTTDWTWDSYTLGVYSHNKLVAIQKLPLWIVDVEKKTDTHPCCIKLIDEPATT